MNKGILYITLFLVLMVCCSLTNTKPQKVVAKSTISVKSKKKQTPLSKSSILQHENLDNAQFSGFNESITQALGHQWLLLQRKRRGKKHFKVGDVAFSQDDLKQTVRQLENWSNSSLVPFSEYFDSYEIKNKQTNTNKTLFTGYYSPIIKVRKTMEAPYIYPIYAKPDMDPDYLPSRRAIYINDMLRGKAEVLAYAKSLIDIQTLQLQGSGYVEFQEDQQQVLFSYGGSNGHPRKSIQRYFQKHYAEEGAGVNMHDIREYLAKHPKKAEDILFSNPSYVFFHKNPPNKKVNGSGNVPLQANISIATDKRYIPTGACLWAERPSSPNFSSKKLSLLLAQDVGGGIKGPNHVDIYTGIGHTGKIGSQFKGYGKMWLILAKKS